MEKISIKQMEQLIIADYQARIEKLQEEMKIELSLLARLADRFEKAESQPLRVRIRPLPTDQSKLRMSAKDRIRATKQILTGRFTRKELHETVNKDGYGQMPEGTFSPYASELARDGELLLIEQATEDSPGKYEWAKN